MKVIFCNSETGTYVEFNTVNQHKKVDTRSIISSVISEMLHYGVAKNDRGIEFPPDLLLSLTDEEINMILTAPFDGEVVRKLMKMIFIPSDSHALYTIDNQNLPDNRFFSVTANGLTNAIVSSSNGKPESAIVSLNNIYEISPSLT